jgi:hypothetical protein
LAVVAATVSVATPPEMVPDPSVVEPSLNVTIPVAVDGLTVADKVTDAPSETGLNAAIAVVVDPRVTLTVAIEEVDVG